MSQKALVLHRCQQTSSAIKAFLNSCNTIASQYEVNLADAEQQLVSGNFDYIICCDKSPEQTTKFTATVKNQL